MKLFDVKLTLISLLGAVLLVQSTVFSMTIEFGSEPEDLIIPGDEWRYFEGTVPPSDPADAWKETDFNDLLWEKGASGFGYGDDDDETVLDMQNKYLTVYIRRDFQASSLPADDIVELVIDYDDGFASYINGARVKWWNLEDDPPTYLTKADNGHNADGAETFVLGTVGELLNDGNNVLAIEGHNVSLTSTDFSLIPALQTASATVQNGQTWIVGTATAALRGSTDAPDAVAVTIDGAPADFNDADGAWSGEASLVPGLNTINVEALDAGASVVDSGSIEFLYVPPENHFSGQLTGDTTWSGDIIVKSDVTVPDGNVLTIEPGTLVMIADANSIIVHGRLLADGTESEPIKFTRYGNGTRWKNMMFIQAADSRLAHCTIEFSDCAGDHKDYYPQVSCDPDAYVPARDYFQAVVAVASHLDIESCLFQHLPDDGSGGQGDAIAIISDDPNFPGDATAHIWNSRFISIGQGIHTRFSYVLVEDCFFTDHHGDNDDIDLYGESDPASLVLNNVMINPGHDDMINPTKCSAIMIGNLIAGCDDHGVVLRDKCYPVMINNIIYDCSSAGIAVQNQCEALLLNNTIVDCGKGVRFFDHTGRWGPEYCLTPGSGETTLINCIIWDCSKTFELKDSPYEPDPGSHVRIKYCNIQGGQSRITKEPDSTVTWGDGNIDADPLFADMGNGDLHLKSAAGRWDPDIQMWVTDDVNSPCIDAGMPYVFEDPNYRYTGQIDYRGELWPHGKKINMGAYGGTPEASMSALKVGNIADVDNNGKVDYKDFIDFAKKWQFQQFLLSEDLNRDGSVDLFDFTIFGNNWPWQE